MSPRYLRRIAALPLLALAVSLSGKAPAQVVVNNITPDGTLGTVVGAPTVTSSNGTQITISGGTLAGANLFHSFTNFDLATGSTATWASPNAPVSNIVNRVTGGNVSNIYGTIDTTQIPGANFFFLNPAGIVFGGGAQINVSAAAHFSTASQLNFADGKIFSVTTLNGSTLSTETPSAFGFLGNEGNIGTAFTAATVPASPVIVTPPPPPAPSGSPNINPKPTGGGSLISSGTPFTSYDLNTPAKLDLSAPSIELTNVNFNANGMNVSAVGPSPFVLELNGPQTSSATGSLTLYNSRIQTEAKTNTGGDINVLAGDVQLNYSTIRAYAGQIDDTTPTSAQPIQFSYNGGNIFVKTGSLYVGNNSSLLTKVTPSSEGRGGNLTVDASGLVTVDGSKTFAGQVSASQSAIQADTTGYGNSGNVAINSDSMLLIGRAVINVQAESIALGNVGNLDVNVKGSLRTQAVPETCPPCAVDVTGNKTFNVVGGTLASTNGGDGLSGNVSIHAGTIDANGAYFDTYAVKNVAGGNLTVTTDGLFSAKNSGFLASTVGTARSGNIFLSAGTDLNFSETVVNAGDNFKVYSGTGSGTGDAGNVELRANGNIILQSNTLVQVEALPAGGNAGSVQLVAGKLLAIDATSGLSSTGSDRGSAGTVDLRAHDAVLNGSIINKGNVGAVNINITDSLTGVGLKIDSDSKDYFQNLSASVTGEIKLYAGTINLTNANITAENAVLGGELITVAARDALTLSSPHISATSSGNATAGSIALNAGGVLNVLGTPGVANSSVVSSSNTANGNAGTVQLSGTDVNVLSGTSVLAKNHNGQGGSVTLTALRNLTVGGQNTSVETTSDGTGPAGNIALNATGALSLSARALISSSNLATGNAGSITIGSLGGPMVTIDGAKVSSAGYDPTKAQGQKGQGGAGSVSVQGSTVTIRNISTLSTNTYKASNSPNAGLVKVAASGLLSIDASSLTSNTYGVGNNPGNAGSVDVSGATITLGKAVLTSDTYGAGNAGNILVNTPSGGVLTISNFSNLSSSSQAPAGATASTGGTGNVTITAGPVTIDQSTLSTNSVNGNPAGTIDLKVASLTMSNASGISSSNKGGEAGVVTIDSAGPVKLDTGSNVKTTGKKGNIFVTAHTGKVSLDNAQLNATGNGAGLAGAINVQAADLLSLGNNSVVSSSNSSGGDAGTVKLSGTDINVLSGTRVLATNHDGQGGSVTLTALRDLTVDGQSADGQSTSVETSSDGIGRAGDIALNATGALGLSAGALVSSSNLGTGNAGSITIGALGGPIVTIDRAKVTSAGYDPTAGRGAAGSVLVQGSAVTIKNGSVLSTNTFKAPDVANSGLAKVSQAVQTTAGSGLIKVASSSTLAIDSSALTSNTYGPGNAGNVDVSGATITLGRAILTSDTYGAGNAGDILVHTIPPGGALTISNASLLSSQALLGSTGGSGKVIIDAGPISILDRSIVSTTAANASPAGTISLTSTGGVTLGGGSSLQTNAASGAAGDITVTMPNTAILLLEGTGEQSSIQTNSGSSTGGEITISNPLAIILKGGKITALGQANGAKVHIKTNVLIASADSVNKIEVNGSFVLDTQAGNVSNLLNARDLNVLDASRVLKGQCPARRADGDTSQLTFRPVGPYVRALTLLPPDPRSGHSLTPGGGCS